MKVTGPSNYHTRVLIRKLWKTKIKIWRAVSKILQKPRRNLAEINLMRLNKLTQKGDIVVIPAKVLGIGNMDHEITAGVFKISKLAYAKMKKANCNIMSLEELLEKYPFGSGIKIIK